MRARYGHLPPLATSQENQTLRRLNALSRVIQRRSLDSEARERPIRGLTAACGPYGGQDFVEHPNTKKYVHEGAMLQFVGLSHSAEPLATHLRENCLGTEEEAAQ
eukprot:9014144-Pyramimonas_sp.AAC.1